MPGASGPFDPAVGYTHAGDLVALLDHLSIGQAALAELGRQAELSGIPAGPLPDMVGGYPGQHWLGLDPHRPEARPLIESLAGLTMPTLVVTGELDVPGCLAMSRVLARRIPGAEAVRVPGAGHMVNMEQPAAFNQLLVTFLNEGCPPPPH